jgi:hypothetical protein
MMRVWRFAFMSPSSLTPFGCKYKGKLDSFIIPGTDGPYLFVAKVKYHLLPNPLWLHTLFMDNDQLLNEIQKLLEGSEKRIAAQITEVRADILYVRESIQIFGKALAANLEALMGTMKQADTTNERLVALTRRVEELERGRAA